MFSMHQRSTENIRKRQTNRKIMNLTSLSAKVPLTPAVDWSNRWCTMPLEREHLYRDLLDFQVRGDDVYIVTFPKCGTTWIQEATWLLVNDLDFQKAKTTSLIRRSIFMDLSVLYADLSVNTVELAEKAAAPRVLKTHLPAHLMPQMIWEKKAKIVYCARNPKDTVVSYYHFHKGLGTWNGTIDEFAEDFVNNDIMYTPYWEHLMEFWLMRMEKNVFFTTYEDMKRNLREVLIRLNQFLEKPLLTEENLVQLEEHLSFENMKANQQTNLTFSIKSGHGSPYVQDDFQFMRRGIVGSYKDELSAETELKLDSWIIENLSKYNITLETIFGKF